MAIRYRVQTIFSNPNSRTRITLEHFSTIINFFHSLILSPSDIYYYYYYYFFQQSKQQYYAVCQLNNLYHPTFFLLFSHFPVNFCQISIFQCVHLVVLCNKNTKHTINKNVSLLCTKFI